MAIAAHPGAVHAAATDTTGEVDGVKNVEFSINGELLDTTDFKDTTGYHSRITGLLDLSMTVSGDYESGDSPQVLIRTSLTSGATLYVRYLPDGSTGFKFAGKVADFKITGEVNGIVQFSATIQATGAIGTV